MERLAFQVCCGEEMETHARIENGVVIISDFCNVCTYYQEWID